MKFQGIAYIVGTLLLAHTLAIPMRTEKPTLEDLSSEIPQAHKAFLGNLDGDLCPTCVSMATEGLEELLNIILNAGVLGSCGDICGALAEKTGSQVVGVACNLLCDFVGVKYFEEAVKKADLDPIYYCELLKFCPINDNGDATFTNLAVSPSSGPQGLFIIDIEYSSENGTGTGELAVAIQTVDGIPVGGSFLLEAQEPGTYKGNIQLKAVPDPDCDPTQDICEGWLPGQYTVKTAICNGECGSKHPHSQIYAIASTTFEITSNIARAVVIDEADLDDEYVLDDLEPNNMNAYIGVEALDVFPTSNDADDNANSKWLLEYDEDDNVQSAIDDTDIDDSSVYPSWLYDNQNAGQDQDYMDENEIDIEFWNEDELDDTIDVIDHVMKQLLQMLHSDVLSFRNDGEFDDQKLGWDESDIFHDCLNGEENGHHMLGWDASNIFPDWLNGEENDQHMLGWDESNIYPDWLNDEENEQ
ncbi:hypothetical protein ScPMuIL_014898 [Solemya velum]